MRLLRGRHTTSLLAAGLILPGVLFVATSSSASSASSKYPENFTPARAGLSDHFSLTSHTIPTGSSETGFLVVTNRTNATINLTKRCQPDVEGLLRGFRYTQPNNSDLVCSTKAFLIRPGVNRLPIRFVATSLSCSQGPNSASGTVQCVDGSKMPSLPPGTYVAHLDGGGAALPVPNAVTVHVTAH